MNKWVIVRLVVVAIAAAEGVINADKWLPGTPMTPLKVIGWCLYGVAVVPIVIWAQRLNPRNTAPFYPPSWRRNPLTLRDPMQFFHMVGFVFAAAGLGMVGHDLYVHLPLRLEHAIWPGIGIGMIVGSYLAGRLFPLRSVPAVQEAGK